jgi:hypothetical protein
VPEQVGRAVVGGGVRWLRVGRLVRRGRVLRGALQVGKVRGALFLAADYASERGGRVHDFWHFAVLHVRRHDVAPDCAVDVEGRTVVAFSYCGAVLLMPPAIRPAVEINACRNGFLQIRIVKAFCFQGSELDPLDKVALSNMLRE